MVKLKRSLRVRPGLPVKCGEISENVKIIRRWSGLDDDGGEGVDEGSGVETTAV